MSCFLVLHKLVPGIRSRYLCVHLNVMPFIIYKISTHDKPFNSLCLESILSKQLSNYHLASHVGQLATPVQVCQPT